MHEQLFAKMDSGCMSTLVMGWGSLPFQPPRSLSAHVQVGKFSLISGVGTLSLYFSSAQLLPLALSLERLPENEAWLLLHLTNTGCLAQEPIGLLLQSRRLDSICLPWTGLAPLPCTCQYLQERILDKTDWTVKSLLKNSQPFNAGGPGSITCWGAKTPHALKPQTQKCQTETILWQIQ